MRSRTPITNWRDNITRSIPSGDSGLRAEIGSAFAASPRPTRRWRFQARPTTKANAGRAGLPSRTEKGTRRPGEKGRQSREELSTRNGSAGANKFDERPVCWRKRNLEPREGRYRAQYGRALTFLPNSRRVAESGYRRPWRWSQTIRHSG